MQIDGMGAAQPKGVGIAPKSPQQAESKTADKGDEVSLNKPPKWAQVLIQQGELNQALMRKELLTRDDVEAALRAGGCLHAHEVERATIETNGQITVVLRRRGEVG